MDILHYLYSIPTYNSIVIPKKPISQQHKKDCLISKLIYTSQDNNKSLIEEKYN